MDTVGTLIPVSEGNHFMVVLSFYDDVQKYDTFQLPVEYITLEIADISIEKIDLDRPIHLRAFIQMRRWLIEQFLLFPNSVFSYICSIDPLETNHGAFSPEFYRWKLFEALFLRIADTLGELGILTQDIIVGPPGYQTFAKVFYRSAHSPVIHLVVSHLNSKYCP